MDILIYGKAHKQKPRAELIEKCGPMQYRKIRFSMPDGYDSYLEELNRGEAHMIFVSGDGADGMEAVIAARNLRPNTAVIWFSDDEGFGAPSFRLGCSYFSSGPITEDVLANAISRCAV